MVPVGARRLPAEPARRHGKGFDPLFHDLAARPRWCNQDAVLVDEVNVDRLHPSPHAGLGALLDLERAREDLVHVAGVVEIHDRAQGNAVPHAEERRGRGDVRPLPSGFVTRIVNVADVDLVPSRDEINVLRLVGAQIVVARCADDSPLGVDDADELNAPVEGLLVVLEVPVEGPLQTDEPRGLGVQPLHRLDVLPDEAVTAEVDGPPLDGFEEPVEVPFLRLGDERQVVQGLPLEGVPGGPVVEVSEEPHRREARQKERCDELGFKSHGPVFPHRLASSASRTFRASASDVKGFWMKAVPASRTPRRAIAVSVYPDI